MHWLTSWFIRNPVAANLLMLVIIVSGLMTLTNMRVEGFPKMPADTVSINTYYYGAYTEQVDETITRKIEKALEGLTGVKRIVSVSRAENSEVQVKMNPGYDLETLVNDIRTRVGSIYNLPADAEKPIITRNEMDLPAVIVQVYGDTDLQTLQRTGRLVREELLGLPEVSKLEKWGERVPEISIRIEPAELEKHNLSIDQIAQKIRDNSLQFRSGVLKTGAGTIDIRADTQAYYTEDFANIPIQDRPDGSRILLRDVATIKDDFQDDDWTVRFDGSPAIGMQIVIGNNDNIIDVVGKVRDLTDRLEKALPEDVHIALWLDWSGFIEDRLTLLGENALAGLLLVFGLLGLFLNLRLAFWVAMGIPISVFGTLAIMGLPALNYSLNDITTFGFIIALGILVDDAVVVGESVHHERKLNPDPIAGTELGVRRVAVATIYGVLTTIAAFLPMLMLNSPIGKVLAGFAGVVILALLFSLLESKFILPSHLARIPVDTDTDLKSAGGIIKRMQRAARGGLQWFNDHMYRPALIWSLKNRYAVLVIFTAFGVLGLGLMGKGFIRTSFFPDVPGSMITIDMEMDARAPYALTLANADHIEEVGQHINQQLQNEYKLDEPPIAHMLVIVSDATTLKLIAEMSKETTRPDLNTYQVMNRWQDSVGELEGTNLLTFKGYDEMTEGFVIQVFGKDRAQLDQASQQLRESLSRIEGVSGVRDDMTKGKSQLKLNLKPEARHLGYTTAYLAQQLTYMYGGAEAQRIQRGNDEVRVMVRGNDEARSAISNLMELRVRSLEGDWIPLLSLADIESGYTTKTINRRDTKMVNNVRAIIDKNVISPSEVYASLKDNVIAQVQEDFPLVTIEPGGELEDMGELQGGLLIGLVVTCLMIYALLAVPLKSYWQPLVIMSIIPFAFIGAGIGHLIDGIPLSVISFFGMLALAGVVVNDSLVMITRFNQAREEEGMNLHDALVTAGTSRMRAIFLTTATTVAGLVPLIRETSEQAQYLIPAAVSLAYGEIFATLIMLLLVPVLLHIILDFAGWVQRIRGNKLIASV